ncbi:MAG: nucleoside monophosphate kinase [Acidobacteriaceae bacterium]|jgi:adenylate kinase|nr:nucleoside monophosphate kinase [Acidobacteriaceae bacterium]
MSHAAQAGQSAASTTSFTPGPVLLLGAPGVGKGTQAKALVEIWKVPQISTGDILRAIKNDPIKAQTPVGRVAKELMEQGLLVPDELVNDLVALRLQEPDTTRGFILDGFPRTLGQAEWLDGHLASSLGTDGQKRPPVVALSVNVGYNQLLRRITGRRNCPVCKSIYNVYTHPPVIEGICDREGAILEQRTDDTEAIFAERMRTYQAQTAPVIDHYRALGRFEELDGELAVEDVTAHILSALVRLRS